MKLRISWDFVNDLHFNLTDVTRLPLLCAFHCEQALSANRRAGPQIAQAAIAIPDPYAAAVAKAIDTRWQWLTPLSPQGLRWQ